MYEYLQYLNQDTFHTLGHRGICSTVGRLVNDLNRGRGWYTYFLDGSEPEGQQCGHCASLYSDEHPLARIESALHQRQSLVQYVLSDTTDVTELSEILKGWCRGSFNHEERWLDMARRSIGYIDAHVAEWQNRILGTTILRPRFLTPEEMLTLRYYAIKEHGRQLSMF